MRARLREWVLRIRGTFARRNDEVEEELRFHLEMAEAEAMRRGASVREARLQAGGLAQAAEEARDQSAFRGAADFLRDARLSVRSLAKQPQFTAVAVISLALGIGANTAMFSVINAAFLRPLRYAGPERLISAAEYNPKLDISTVIMPDFAAWKLHNQTFEQIEAYGRTLGRNLTAPDMAAERVQVGHVTPGFFAMLGIRPQIGRDFEPGESVAGRNAVVLISDSLWRNYFQAQRDMPGKGIFLGGAPYTVIGVMPPNFVYPDSDDEDQAALWAPDAVNAADSVPSHGRQDVFVIGRLKPGITLEQARANLETITRGMDGKYPRPIDSAHAASSARVLPLQEHLAGSYRMAIFVLMGAVGCILLIVCANVANLSLARSFAREREIAIRAAIGASRFRVARLLLAESLVLAAAGGILGTSVAYWTASVLGFLLPATIPRPIPVDLRVLGFAAVCSLGTAVLFGLAPSLRASKLDLNGALKEGGTHGTSRRNRWRLRESLAVAQLALCLVLLVGAGLLIRTFVNLLSVRVGFDPQKVLLASLQLQPRKLYGPDRQRDFARRVLGAVQALPGIESAALTSEPPVAASVIFPRIGFQVEGEAETGAVIYTTSVTEDYFRVLRIGMLQGRSFDEGDREGREQVIVLSRSAARILFQNRNPEGRRVLEPNPFGGQRNRWTVVGVVGDVRHEGLEGAVWPEIFRPLAQAPAGDLSLAVRAFSDPSSLAPAIRKAVGSIDRGQPVFGVETVEALLSNSVAQRRQRAVLLGTFASLSLLVTIVGIYGVMAYSVTRRTHEIGVRIAMGARRRDVLTMVVGEGLVMAAIGVAIGVLLSLVLTRVLEGLLFGLGPRDKMTYAIVSLVLVLATSLASYAPASRATRTDPIRALRHE